MFNRRFYRTKIFQQLYAYVQDNQANLTLHEKTMFKSLDKAYELYVFLLSFPVEFRFYISKELEMQKSKFIPNQGIITQVEALYNNLAIIQLEQSEELIQQVKHLKIKWSNKDDVFKRIWQMIKSFEPFGEYGKKEKHGFFEDKRMLSDIMQYIITECDLLDSYVEEKYINWEDDQTWAMLTLIKTIEAMKDKTPFVLETGYMGDKEGMGFMRDLFRKTIEKQDELTQIIALKTTNWETDRIALSDMLLMKMALAEILYFPYIPVKVSINEYLELAKLYSTPQSHGFINGVLDKIQIDLRKQDKIVKLGRGLVE